jgi:hypothetical protein
MRDLLQIGQHPDADQLSAFAEHVLPPHEHAEVLAHMAVCAACREVAVLALPPMGDAEVVPVAEAPRSWFLGWGAWFSGWRLVWPAMAAVAAMLAVVAYRHQARPEAVEPGQQVAEIHAPAPPPSAAPLGEADATDGVRKAADKAADKAIARKAPAQVGGMAIKVPAPLPPSALDRKDVPDLPMEGRNVQALPQGASSQAFVQQRSGPSQQQQSITQGRVPAAVALGMGSGGMPAAVAQAKPAAPVNLGRGMPALGQTTVVNGAQPSAIGGPVVPPIGNATAPVRLANAAPPPAALPAATFALPPPPPPPVPAPAARQTQTVIAGAALDALAVEPESNASAMVIRGAPSATLSTASRPALRGPLPSKLAALSVMAQGPREVAMDVAHALFVSEDGGVHWKGVKPRWKGQAVRLELANGAVPAAAPALFAGSMNGFGRGMAAGALSNADIGNSTVAAATATATASPVGAGAATLTGTVSDPVGAVIPGATVKVTNSASGAAVSVRSDRSGRYGLGGLAAGTYRVDATAPGFTALQTRVELTASQQAVSNLRLTVGAASETVTVTNAAPAIDLEQATLQSEVKGKMEAKARKAAPPVFAITTEKGERWVSLDGQSWTRQ